MNLATFLLGEHLAFEFGRSVSKLNVSVNFSVTVKHTGIKRHDVLRGKETNVELIKLGLDRWGRDKLFDLGFRVIFNGNLIVSVTGDGHRDLKVASNLAEVLALGIAHNDPLVH